MLSLRSRRSFFSKVPLINYPGPRAFSQRVLFVSVDEFHCIEAEGESFRPMYRQISQLTYRLEGKLWAIATATATAAPATRSRLQASLRFTDATATVLVDSNDRKNIAWVKRFIKRKVGDYSKTPQLSDLHWVLETVHPMATYEAALAAGKSMRQIEDECPEPPKSGSTIIFINDIKGVYDLFHHLRSFVPVCLRQTIQPYFAMLDSTVKVRILAQMTEGTLRILVATKAAELGVDMRDVVRVVVWMPREGVDALVQQAGRDARRGEQGLVVVYCASNLRKAAEEEGHKSSKEVSVAISVDRVCGVFFSEKHCIRSAPNRHYEQMPSPEDVHPRGSLCCNLCGDGFVSPDSPSGIDWRFVRPPFGIRRIVPAASEVPVPNGHFDMKAEEKTLVSRADALCCFGQWPRREQH